MWLVERLRFNKRVRQYEFDKTYTFDSDDELLNFIKSVMIYGGLDYLWRITKTEEEHP